MTTEQQQQKTSGIHLWVYKLIAVISLILAIIGAILPGLPTTEFVILCAWASAKGSPTIHRFLMSKPFFRNMIENWQNGKVISRKNKILSALSMSVCLLILLLHKVAFVWVAVSTMGMLIGSFYIWRRPEKVPEAPDLSQDEH
ncbi:YbaN family protein [Vibrio rhizosphaerae]|uniref:Inner membrane protein n=1 Tax=Vibrio rhizosphaerae TaxID=398736 RepID=A0ABU4IRY5_9VIBR|nr:YbaN family protein [Vibrio rhizosphaerae]MDW6092171.1 YbaN family protein [Vibrio rhizosphaerae]